MKILVIGSGGREHALCWKLKQSQSVDKIYVSPGNGGTQIDASNVNLDIDNHREIVKFCRDKCIDLVVVGPEAPLAAGVTDDLEKDGINVFGPSRKAARLETDKIFAKELMARHGIPTAEFEIFDNYKNASAYINSVKTPIVVKAYGLAAGKGVIVADDKASALKAARGMLIDKKFGEAGSKIIVEDCLQGEEVSIIALTDGKDITPLATSQDHKRALDGDCGPNTGGMGAYSPTPVVDEVLFDKIMNTIIRPTIEALCEEGIIYKGVLYCGIMITASGPMVLEYNARFGDPEAQVILPRMKGDLAQLLLSIAKGSASSQDLKWDEREYVCVVLASGGYPDAYEKGKTVTGCEKARKEGAIIFHAGTKLENGKLVSSGGRVLNVVGMGDGIKEAIDNTYRAVSKIHFENMHYRRDIGARALERVILGGKHG